MQLGAAKVSHIPRNIDAVTLLKADHRYIEDMFLEFERTETPVQKQQLAIQICMALMVHRDIERELFYPAFLEGTRSQGLQRKAMVDHDEVDQLVSAIMNMSAEDESFDAKIHVLSELIGHHVREEERIGGLFSAARKSMMDLMTLGQAMQRRRGELLGSCAF
jgi:hypothetical protein